LLVQEKLDITNKWDVTSDVPLKQLLKKVAFLCQFKYACIKLRNCIQTVLNDQVTWTQMKTAKYGNVEMVLAE
jgi:hypothetical protein